jgi:predicted Zn-dependent protease with MMP-like domain
MTRAEFEKLVVDILKTFPSEFKERLENVDVVIEDEIDNSTMKMLGLGARGRLLGLYQGVPLKDRTHYYGLVMPDKITLFKQNIERACEAGGLDLREEIKHVIQHEIAHHFGISDQELRDSGTY